MLEGWGYHVVAVENPDLAARLLEDDPAFDLLFTDVVMPGVISAVQLANIAQERRPGIGVLLTSGYARDLIPKHDGPEFPIIVKPYRSDELAARIRAVLAARNRPAAAVAASRTPTPALATDRPRRVLFVEDEVVLRMSTVDMLERLGCLVAAVGSGEHALEILDRGSDFDLLLTDLGLPGMTGEQLAAEVQNRFPKLPVIIASGYAKSSAEPGALRFIGKPYSSIDLQQALDELGRKANAL
jgi:CheY-like chemotaxis protein